MENNNANSFEITLREMRGGRSLTELSEVLAKLVEGVRRTGNGGSLSYKMRIKPAAAGDSVILQCEDEVTVKMPSDKRGGSIFYADDQNGLQRRDPRQRELELKSLPAVAAAASEVVPAAVSS